MPILFALLFALALTTACARLNLELKGCSGRVYLRAWTAKARCNGARLVCRTVQINTSSVISGDGEGRAREASMAEGLWSCIASREEALLRLEAGLSVDVEGRFLEDDARLAAWRIDLACLGSGKIA